MSNIFEACLHEGDFSARNIGDMYSIEKLMIGWILKGHQARAIFELGSIDECMHSIDHPETHYSCCPFFKMLVAEW
jgi:hypothetical protein